MAMREERPFPSKLPPKHSFQASNHLPIISETRPDLNRDFELLFKTTSTTGFEDLFLSDRNLPSLPYCYKLNESLAIKLDSFSLYDLATVDIMKSLKHKNITAIIEVCRINSLEFIVTVLELPQYSLNYILHEAKEDYDYDYVNVLHWSHQLAEGISYLHKQNLIAYIALQPKHLLLFKEGTVLKLQWRVSTLDDRFRSDMFIDIPCAYLSPETIQGSPLDSQVTVERTIKSDMFSFAVIVWEMVTRQNPLQSLINSVQQKNTSQPTNMFVVLLHIIDGGRLPTIVNIPEVINELFNSFLVCSNFTTESDEWCWAQSPDDRPSAEYIVGKLGKMLASSPNCPPLRKKGISYDDMAEAFKQAVMEKGSLTCHMAQIMPFGPPRVGKTCLYNCLLDRLPPGYPSTHDKLGEGPESTNALEERKTIEARVTLEPNERACSAIVAGEKEWKEIQSLPDEIAMYMKNLSARFMPNQLVIPRVNDTPPVKPIDDLDNDVTPPSITPQSEAPVPIIDLPPQPKSPTYQPPTFNFAKIMTLAEIDLSKIQPLLDKNITIFYTDSGGQPEFHEVLPGLVSGPTVFLLVFNLYEGLKSLYKVRYESSLGKQIAYESSFTVEEVLMQCLASINSYYRSQLLRRDSQDKKVVASAVKVLMVATHSDLVEKGTIKRIDAALKRLVRNTGILEEGILEPFSEEQLLIPVNNYDLEDGGIVRKVISRVIKREDESGTSPFKVELPVHWLGLEITLRKLDSSTISLKKCVKLAADFNISPQELPSCLKFLHHKTGTIRYYEKVNELKEIVIVKPNIIFVSLTEFITNTFNFENVGVSVKMAKKFRKFGLFKIAEVKTIFNKHKKILEITFDQFVALLFHLNILGPAHKTGYDYFLPCALVHVPSSTPTAINARKCLLMSFKSGFVPKGVFSGLLAFLCQRDWIILHDGDGQPRLSRNQATLQGESCTVVTMRADARYIELQLELDEEDLVDRSPYLPMREELDICMTDVLEILQYEEEWSIGIYCCHSKCSKSDFHFAKIVDVKFDGASLQALCSTTEKKYRVPDAMANIWFETSKNEITCSEIQDAIQRNELPKMPVIKSIVNVPKFSNAADPSVLRSADPNEVFALLKRKHALQWNEIGCGLEVQFEYREELRKEGIQSSDKSKLERVIHYWAQTHCSEVSWDNVIESLKSLQLMATVEEVQQFLSSKEKERSRSSPYSAVPSIISPSLHHRPLSIIRVSVMYSYSAVREDEVNMREGDVVEVIDRETGCSGWWRVRTADHKEGLAPHNYLELQ